MFCGSMYWNWKLRPKVRNLFGRSTGIPIPTMNWRELGKMFRKIHHEIVCVPFERSWENRPSNYLHRADYFYCIIVPEPIKEYPSSY